MAKAKIKHKYSEESYFDFLFDLGFTDERYRELAEILHEITYYWSVKMDENRMYDGIDIRKYYLCDELGYMPDDIDPYDCVIFPEEPSVLEVMIGFANRICRDILGVGEISELVGMFIKSLKLDIKSGIVGYDKNGVKKKWDGWDFGIVESTIKKWDCGMELSIFPISDEFWGEDLWSQANIWLNS